jgi:hypothetical protein
VPQENGYWKTDFSVCLLLQIPIVDDEMKKAAGEVKDDGKMVVIFIG